MRRLVFSLLAALACFAQSTVSAREPVKFADDFAELQKRDAYLQQVGWRLLKGNVPFCEQTQLSVGLLLQDAGAYGQATDLRELLNLDGDFFVQSVISEAPADQAGITAQVELYAIDSKPLRGLPIADNKPWERLATVNQMIRQSLSADGSVWLSHARNGKVQSVRVAGSPICDSYFELISGSESASANGTRVAIGRDFAGFEYAEDELAAALAHELAHNLLGHPTWLDSHNRKRKAVRKTEREADRLIPWLLANAGYNPNAAVRFMERWGPRHSGGLFRKRSHDGWDERAALIADELPLVAASIAEYGAADWQQDFKPQFERNSSNRR